MKERPMLMSAPMVRAILDGRKTMTRRVLKPQPFSDIRQDGLVAGRTRTCSVWQPNRHTAWFDWGNGFDPMMWIDGPYREGMHLWLRETIDATLGCDAVYVADGERLVDALGWEIWHGDNPKHLPVRIIPSIHMPRWASRITLEVTGVRVERLQDISESDVAAEGCEVGNEYWYSNFRTLWDSINAGRGYGWETNPYVWVVEFLARQGQTQLTYTPQPGA